MRATVITDASFCPNSFSAGWAAWVRVDGIGYAIKKSGNFRFKPRDSNEAKRNAAMNGISVAKNHGATIILTSPNRFFKCC